jgi:peptidoglycan/LPS O-acetylase OafA/YrhL
VRRLFRLELLPNHFPALHGIRVLAILSIIQFHVTCLFETWRIPLSPVFTRYSKNIWFGMDLFFVLSGFLIGSMLLQDDALGSPRATARFWARRAFRILPLYYVVLTLLVVCSPIAPSQRDNLWREYLYVSNYATRVGPPVMFWGWSLCVEEHFYLVIPFVLLGLRALRDARARLAALGALWLTAVVLRALAVSSATLRDEADLMLDVYPRTHLRFDILVAGLVVAELYHHHADAVRARLSSVNARAALAAWCALCVAWLAAPPSWATAPVRACLSWGVVTSALYVPLVLFLLVSSGSIVRALSASVFRTFATLGYGVYLVHLVVLEKLVMPVVVIFGLTLLRRGVALSLYLYWILALALTFALSLLTAWALHVTVDKLSLHLRDRLLPRRRESPHAIG